MANGDYAWTNGDWAYNNALEAGKDKQMISEGKGRGNRLLPSTWEEDLYTGSPFRLWRSFGLSFSCQIDTVTSIFTNVANALCTTTFCFQSLYTCMSFFTGYI